MNKGRGIMSTLLLITLVILSISTTCYLFYSAKTSQSAARTWQTTYEVAQEKLDAVTKNNTELNDKVFNLTQGTEVLNSKIADQAIQISKLQSDLAAKTKVVAPVMKKPVAPVKKKKRTLK